MCIFISCFLGAIFCIGAIIDEASGHQQKINYITQCTNSRARTILVFVWIMVGFLMTISYKSVLRAMMMTTEYDQTIDTIDDMLKSELPLWMANDTSLKLMLKTDPREKVKELGKLVNGYPIGAATRTEEHKMVEDGIITHKLVGIGCGHKAVTFLKCIGEKVGKCHRSKDAIWLIYNHLLCLKEVHYMQVLIKSFNLTDCEYIGLNSCIEPILW